MKHLTKKPELSHNVRATIWTLILLVATTLSCNLYSQNSNTTKTIKTNKNRVEIKENRNGNIEVKVFNRKNNQELKKIYEAIFTDEKSYEKWSVKESLGFNFILGKKKRYYSMTSSINGIGWGLTTITDGYNLNDVGKLSLKTSNEFFFNICSITIPIYKNVFGISTAIGGSWHNFHLRNNDYLKDINGVTEVLPALKDHQYYSSRLRTFHLNIPIVLEWQPRGGHIFMSAGVIGGINLFASHRVKYYDSNGDKRKSVYGKGLNTAPLSLDFIGQIGINYIGIYAKYSPFSMFQKNRGIDAQVVSVGIFLSLN